LTALAIARRDLTAALNQPLAAVLLASFAALNASYVFFLRAFFVAGGASLRSFFEVAPLLMCFFAPALAMRALAEERRSGTLALLFSWPVSEWSVVGGKLLANLVLLSAALLLTAGLPLTVSLLGTVDPGEVLSGYLGLWLLGGTLFAVALLAGGWSRSQAVAFVLGFGASAALYLAGRAAPFLPSTLGYALSAVSLEARYAALSTGVVDVRDLCVFFGVSLVCLAGTVEVLAARRWR
jgi:ABC-2 type transport system permease protein